MTISILNAPASQLPKVGAALFSLNPWPTISQEMSMLAAIGATMVRLEVLWSDVETSTGFYAVSDKTDGRIAAAKAAGLTVVIVLDYSNPLYTGNVFAPPTTNAQLTAWGNFCAYVAGFYAGTGVVFEVWNEPNNPQFWSPGPSASQYATVLAQAVSSIRARVPSAQIISGGVGDLGPPGINAAPFMQAANAAQPSIIASLAGQSLHPYNPGQPETLFGYVDNYRAVVPTGAPIAITEWGYCASWLAGQANVPEIQRAYWAARMIGASICYGITGLCFYNLRDTGTNQTDDQNTFGLFNYGFQPKPAVAAVANVMKVLAGTVTYDAEKLANGVYRITLRKANGIVTKLLWTDGAAITHMEPMTSLIDAHNVMGNADGFNYANGRVLIALCKDWPMQIVSGAP